MNDFEFKKEDLLEAGVNLGDLTKNWNPKMKRYDIIKSKPPKIYPNPQARAIHIFDPQKIIDCFQQQIKPQIEKLIEKHDKSVLFLGTSPHLAEIVKQAAISCSSPYLVHRWVGGFLTNFEVISRNISKLKRLIFLQQSEKFATLSKKDQAETKKKINKLKKTYEGVLYLPISERQFHSYCSVCQEKITITGAHDHFERLKNETKKHLVATHPEKANQKYSKWIEPFESPKKINILLFVIGLKKEKTALKEAKDSHTPVLAICNTSRDPDLVDYIILGNDWNKKSVSYVANKVAEIIRKSKLKKSNNTLEQENSSMKIEEENKNLSNN